MRSNACKSSRQRGVALIATLILALAVTIILGNIFYRHQIQVSQTAGSLHSDQALLLAISAENWARDLISSENDTTDTDHFGEDWARAIPYLPVDGGSISGCIVDLQSRFNLNSFGKYTISSLEKETNGTSFGHARVWQNLMLSLDLLFDSNRVPVIIDWLDNDNNTINPSGAERDQYSFFNPPRFPHNDLISDPGELAAMKGYSLLDVQVLSPYMATIPESTPINVNTAPEQVLLALSDDMGSEFVDLVITNRPFEKISEFYSAIDQYLMIGQPQVQQRWPADLVSINSSYFQLNMEVKLGQSKLHVKSIMHRSGRGAPAVIRREITVVPAGVATLIFPPASDDEDIEAFVAEADDSEGDKKYYMQPLCESVTSTDNSDY